MIAVVSGLLISSVATAASASTLRWPGTKIRVCDRSGYPRNVAQAISWWNRTPSRLHLYRSCSAPQIVVRRYFRRTPGIAGYAQYPPVGRVMLNHYWMGKQPRTQRSDIAAHEIGHAIGLRHLAPCSLMYGGPGLGENCDAPEGSERCGPQKRDARVLLRLYGGGPLGDFRGNICHGTY